MAIFAGKYKGTIDDKGRVVLPAAFKKAMGELKLQFVVLERNRRNKCIDIHTVDAWEKDVEKFKKDLNPSTSPQDDLLLELYFDNFVQVGVAANGRINIPAEFLGYADLKDKVMFRGMHTSIRMTAETKEEQRQVSDEAYLDMLKRLDELKRGGTKE
jgi:MraZ protein